MKVFSQLVSAQLENKGSDYSAGTKGRMWFNTGSGLVKFDDGSNVKVVSVTTDVIPATTGGTGQSTYTQGDILYCSATNVLSKLAKGTSGQFLHQGATIPDWSTVAATLGVLSKSSGYTIGATDDLILVDTGSAFNLTLPASSGGGKVYRVKKVTTDLNACSILRAGSDTIFDIQSGGTSTTLNTIGEELMIIDASAGVWHVIDRRVPCSWQSYTPTMVGFGSTTAESFIWRRCGSSIDIKGSFTAGTVAASAATFTLPTGLVIGSGVVTTLKGMYGHYTSLAAGGADNFFSTDRAGFLHIDTGTSTSLVYFAQDGASNIYSDNLGNAIAAGTGDTISLSVNGLNISGWNE